MSEHTNEKTTFGAVIERPPRTSNTTDAPPSPLTTHSTHPNPFYENSLANRTSVDLKVPDHFTRDLESARSNGADSARPTCASKQSGHDSMWPSMKSQKAKAKQEKCAKSWNPMARMGKKQKIIASVIIAVLIIGAAVGVGVGVSIATGNGVKSANGDNKPVAGHGSS